MAASMQERDSLGAPEAACCARMCTRPGRPKASVLPEPVAAMPTRSRPDRMMGQHCAWMGEGCEKPLVDCSSSCEKPAEAEGQEMNMAHRYLSA